MNNRGQALVEMAIVILLLFLLVFGIFQFGWLMYIKNTLNNAARAGARYAVVTKPSSTTGWTQSDVDSITNSTKGSLYYIKASDVTISVYNNGSAGVGVLPQPGDTIQVTVTLSPIPQFAPGFINVMNSLTGQASMRYE